MKRYVIVENGRSIVSLTYGDECVETMFRSETHAKELMERLMTARPNSKFRVADLNII